MTISEIKAVLPPVAIRMASAAIMEGVKAYHKAKEQREIEANKEQSGEKFNYMLAHAYNEGIQIASEVLWKLFASCSAECQQAIAEVAKVKDGFSGNNESYFDDFINALEKVQCHSVWLRVAE